MTQLPCANLSTARKWYGHSMLSEEVFASFPRLPALPLFLRSSSYRAHTHTPASPRLSHLLGVPTWMGQMVQPQPHELHTVQPQSRNLRGPTRGTAGQYFLAESCLGGLAGNRETRTSL